MIEKVKLSEVAIINDTITGMDASDIYAVDKAMIEADGTKDKSKLGANAYRPFAED